MTKEGLESAIAEQTRLVVAAVAAHQKALRKLRKLEAQLRELNGEVK